MAQRTWRGKTREKRRKKVHLTHSLSLKGSLGLQDSSFPSLQFVTLFFACLLAYFDFAFLAGLGLLWRIVKFDVFARLGSRTLLEQTHSQSQQASMQTIGISPRKRRRRNDPFPGSAIIMIAKIVNLTILKEDQDDDQESAFSRAWAKHESGLSFHPVF